MATSSHHDKSLDSSTNDTRLTRRDVLAVAALGAVAPGPGVAFAAISQGQLTLGVHVSLAPTWFDPADTQAFITPFMVLYALHDAVMKPMPDKLHAPSPSGVLVGLKGPSHLRIRTARRPQVPQWRAGDRRGCEVLVRAVSRHLLPADQGSRGSDRNT